MRRKRRFKGTWLPNLGTLFTATPSDSQYSFVSSNNLTVGATDFNMATAIAPIVFDDPAEQSFSPSADSMADIIGSEYVLRRAVGKFHCAVQQITNPAPRNVLVGLGIFVARCDATSPAVPIGETADYVVDYNPLSARAIREPWLFHRVWVLGNQTATAGNPVGSGTAAMTNEPSFPKTTAEYNSVADGPHIDAKTIRRIRQDERLFYAVGAQRWSPTFAPTAVAVGIQVGWSLSLRLFGALRKARNSGTF